MIKSLKVSSQNLPLIRGGFVFKLNKKVWKLFVYTNIVYTFIIDVKQVIAMKKKKPMCGCGNTQNPNGFCDGSHSKNP